MTIEVIILALASTIRPTSLAAVYALLATKEPRRLMIAYIVVGLAFTVAFGLLVIWVAGGADVSSGTSETKSIAAIVGGVIVLCLAVGLLTGRLGGPRTDDAPPRSRGRWDTLLKRRMTLKTAALAGPVTHVPGVFYLIALNLIVAHQPSVPGGLVEVLIYNMIWFALPIAALAVCVVAPDTAIDTVAAIQTWAKEHARQIMLVVSFGVGIALILRGVLNL